jgi:hypothetical protein
MIARGGRIGAAVVMALLSAGCSGESDDGPAPAAVQTTRSATSVRVPKPTAEQKAPYLAIAAQLNPGLGHDKELAMEHADRICKGILGGPTYGSSLIEFARAELSSGSRDISVAETERAVKAIKLWCH